MGATTRLTLHQRVKRPTVDAWREAFALAKLAHGPFAGGPMADDILREAFRNVGRLYAERAKDRGADPSAMLEQMRAERQGYRPTKADVAKMKRAAGEPERTRMPDLGAPSRD